MKEIDHNEVEINQSESLPQHLYHYTRINCLKDIFNDEKGKNVCIQFTDMHFLNDIDEGIYFYKFLEKHKEEIVGQFKNGDEQEYCRKTIDDFLPSSRSQSNCPPKAFSISALWINKES